MFLTTVIIRTKGQVWDGHMAGNKINNLTNNGLGTIVNWNIKSLKVDKGVFSKIALKILSVHLVYATKRWTPKENTSLPYTWTRLRSTRNELWNTEEIFLSQWTLNSSSQYKELFLGCINDPPSWLLPGMLLKIPELVPSSRNPDLIDWSEKAPGHGVIRIMIQG